MVLHRVGARLWIARIMITWGLISGAMIFVRTPFTFYVLRFLLGVGRGRVHPRHPALSHLLVSGEPARADHRNLPRGDPGGRHLRRPAVRVDPESAQRRLRPQRLAVAVPAGDDPIAGPGRRHAGSTSTTASPRPVGWTRTRSASSPGTSPARRRTRRSSRTLLAAFRTGRVWLLGLIYFCVVSGIYIISFWLPTIIKQTGCRRPAADRPADGLAEARGDRRDDRRLQQRRPLARAPLAHADTLLRYRGSAWR